MYRTLCKLQVKSVVFYKWRTCFMCHNGIFHRFIQSPKHQPCCWSQIRKVLGLKSKEKPCLLWRTWLQKIELSNFDGHVLSQHLRFLVFLQLWHLERSWYVRWIGKYHRMLKTTWRFWWFFCYRQFIDFCFNYCFNLEQILPTSSTEHFLIIQVGHLNSTKTNANKNQDGWKYSFNRLGYTR